jgi:hypothetical protein
MIYHQVDGRAHSEKSQEPTFEHVASSAFSWLERVEVRLQISFES